MAVTLRQPGQHVIAASAAALALAGLLAAPVLAAPERGLLCDDSTDSALTVSTSELTATPVNSSDKLVENHLLRPNTKAAVRGAFPEDTPDADSDAPVPDADTTDTVAPESGIRSTPETGQSVYKRQMYRRDI